MINISVLTSEIDTKKRIETVINSFQDLFNTIFCNDKKEFIESIHFDFSEINIIHLESEKEIKGLLKKINSNSGINLTNTILITSKSEYKKLENNCSVISIISEEEIEIHLPKILRILNQNKDFLYRKFFYLSIKSHFSGLIIVHNDPFELSVYANIFGNFLFNINFFDLKHQKSFCRAIRELSLNAVEHGNCGISHQEKEQNLIQGINAIEYISKKNKEPAIAHKCVFLSYNLTPERAFFTIKDEGSGFDWQYREDSNSKETGIKKVEKIVENLEFNSKGNSVSFSIPCQREYKKSQLSKTNTFEEMRVSKDQEILKQGEASKAVYYIVSGSYSVIVNSIKITSLHPSNIFLGESSFLLNQGRTATIIAEEEGTLVRIPKEEFIKLIEKNPLYGIFLSRILAERISELHDQFIAVRQNANQTAISI